jgi:hypothetical protein
MGGDSAVEHRVACAVGEAMDDAREGAMEGSRAGAEQVRYEIELSGRRLGGICVRA